MTASRNAACGPSWKKLPYTIAFLDGRHENFTLLDQYPVTEWNGGRVQEVSKNLLHLMRGEIYEIEGESYFVFGGGESPDHAFRTEGSAGGKCPPPGKS